MTAKDLLDKTAHLIIRKIKRHKGLEKFATKRSKFEGWLKVEFVEILINQNYEVAPEINKIDIIFNQSAIELKTINTSYKYEGAEKKSKPITKNVKGIIDDIVALKTNSGFINKYVIFITFPVRNSKSNWNYHLKKIKVELSEISYKEFTFKNGIPAVIYYGKI